jgi:hypothetical protein
MMEQCIGVISGIALRKVSCVRKNPRKDAAKIFTKSPRSTFSAGMNNERIQKNALAPSDLTVKIASGDMALDVVRSLHTIIFMPKMA